MFDANHNQGYYLHHAMNKYGIDNFEFKVIIHNVPEDKLDFYEKLWIQKLDTMNRDKGYNLLPGGSVNRGENNPMYGKTPWNKGIPRTEEEKQHMRDWFTKQKALGLWPIKNRKPRKPHVYTEEEKNRLSLMLSGENNGFYGKHHSEETINIIKQKNRYKAKPVEMIDSKTGEVLKVFDGVREAARYINETMNKTNADKSLISRCASGKYSIAYGFKWRFSERCND